MFRRLLPDVDFCDLRLAERCWPLSCDGQTKKCTRSQTSTNKQVKGNHGVKILIATVALALTIHVFIAHCVPIKS